MSGHHAFLQTAKVLGLASLLAIALSPRASAQSARVEVTAMVVDAAPSRAAVASARWLSAGKGERRKDAGLATVVVNREQRRASINYLRN